MAMTPPRTPPTSIPSTPDPNATTNGRPSSPTPSNTPLPTPGLDSSFPAGSPGSVDSIPSRPGLTSPGSRKGSFRTRISSVMRRNSSVISAVNAFASNLKDKDKDKNSDKDSQKDRKSRTGSLSFSGRNTPARRSSESALRESANIAAIATPPPPTSPPAAAAAAAPSVPATPAAVDLEAPIPTTSTTSSDTPTNQPSSAPPSILEPEQTILLPSPEIQPSPPSSAPGTPKPRLDRSRLSVLGRGDYMMPSPVAESPMREAAAMEAEKSTRLSQAISAPSGGLERIDSEGAKEGAYHQGDVTDEPGRMPEPQVEAGGAPGMPVPEPAVVVDEDEPRVNGHAKSDSARTSEEYVRVPPVRDIDAEEAAAKRIQRAWRRSQSSDTVKPQITAPVITGEIIEPPAYSDTEGAAKKIQRAWRRHSSHSHAHTNGQVDQPGPSMPVPEPVVMPLPPLKDLLHSPTESSADTVGYAASERTPLLGKTTAPPGRAVDLLDNALGFPTSSTSSPSGSRSRATGVSPAALGWTEHHLPDLSHTYFHHVRMGVTTDIDLRVADKVEKIQSWMEGSRIGDSEEATRGMGEGRRMEVWVREGKKGAFERWWVDHEWRDVAKDGVRREHDEDLDTAFRYWSYVDAHPAHIQLKPAVVKEAQDTLAWARSEAVLPGSSSSHQSVPGVASFTRQEVDELQTLLSTSAQSGGAMQTRIVARIMLRAVEFRQRTQRPHKPLPVDVPSSTQHAHVPVKKVHFGKSVLDIFVGVSCLGIPFLFLNRNRNPRVHGGFGNGFDMEAGYAMSGPGPTLMVCACSCLTAAIVLSASVTFISLPNLDELARLAALLAILASTASMASTVLALFRYKIDIERTALLPHPFAAGAEGIIGFTKRSVLMSMPLVFLAWAVIAFAAGIGAYAISVGSGPGNGGLRKIAQGVAQWTILCAFGGVVGVVLTGAVFVRQ